MERIHEMGWHRKARRINFTVNNNSSIFELQTFQKECRFTYKTRSVPTALLIHKEGATSPTLNSDDRRSLNAEICYNKIQQCVAFEVHIFCGTIIQWTCAIIFRVFHLLPMRLKPNRFSNPTWLSRLSPQFPNKVHKWMMHKEDRIIGRWIWWLHISTNPQVNVRMSIFKREEVDREWASCNHFFKQTSRYFDSSFFSHSSSFWAHINSKKTYKPEYIHF